VAERAVESGGGAMALQDARSITEGALATVRDLSHLLHPAMLDDLGLPAAVEWHLRGFGRRYGIRVDLIQHGRAERLAPEIEAAAYRIVQEALTNVAKHARATACSVQLERKDHLLRVVIEDDGVGMEEGYAGAIGARSGLGLIGMRERASQFGGSVRIDTAPGKGTRVIVELPARTRQHING
jgi:signal transduction histidine kinase